ncbi:MAG: NADH-quinone oxidoreductase subunit M, partial [Candidatus Methylomirabilales bacterium]
MSKHRTPNIELMNQLSFPILSVVTFLPLFGAFVLLFMPRREGLIRGFALSIAVLDLLLSLPLFFAFRPEVGELQFVEKVPWFPEGGISYFLGIDGLSILLVLLTTFLSAVSILASFSIAEKVKEYMISMLILETGMVGVFVAHDLFLFYIFWEGMLIPMYFLIGIWGGVKRVYATWKFILYTMAGSVLMLVGILVLYFQGGRTFDLQALSLVQLPPTTQRWLFLAFAISFAIKVPLFPFHTWLPDAHVEAPTAGSVLLAGILLKMGTYGFLRFALPLFPQASLEFAPLIAWLAIVGILYGALVSMVQPDLKTLIAYSSVSHLGFVMLGMFAFNLQGVQGSILQMVNHGLSTGALFLIVGILYERLHTRMIQDMGGLWRPLPVLGAIFLIVVFSSIGLPGLNGFVGEFLILVGAFQRKKLYGVLAALGVILSAVYMLWMIQRVMFGELRHPERKSETHLYSDLTARELGSLLPVVIFCFWIGLYPRPFLERTEASAKHLLQQIQAKQAVSRQPSALSVKMVTMFDGGCSMFDLEVPFCRGLRGSISNIENQASRI